MSPYKNLNKGTYVMFQWSVIRSIIITTSYYIYFIIEEIIYLKTYLSISYIYLRRQPQTYEERLNLTVSKISSRIHKDVRKHIYLYICIYNYE
jgi:hypothetical protein